MSYYPQFDFDFDLYFDDIINFCSSYKIDLFNYDYEMQKVLIRRMLKKIAHGSHEKL